MIVRRAAAEDVAELTRLRVEFLNEVNDRSEPPAGFAGDLERYFRAAMADGSFLAWLAEEDGRIVATSGMCLHRVAPNYSNPSGNTAYVLNMYTAPEFRGRGLASQLFSRLIEEARGRGCGKMALHATEAGRRVYERFGFRPSGDEMCLKL